MKETRNKDVENPLIETSFNAVWFRHGRHGWRGWTLISLMAVNLGCNRLWSAPEVSHSPSFHPIDLTSFYSERFPTGSVASFWNRLPRGPQTLASVPFVVGGKLELTGMDAARVGAFHPPRVTGIPIARMVSRLHLLHGAAHGGKDGTPLDEMVVHYANGEECALRIAYGVHARNWIREPGERRDTLEDPNSVVAWSSPARNDEESAGRFRFFKTTFQNPLPDQEIASVDFVSLFNKATPIVFALTVEQGDTPGPAPDAARLDRKTIRDANAYGESVFVGTMRVHVLQAANRSPVTNGSVNVTLSDGGTPYFFGGCSIDSQGAAVFWYPAQHAVALHVQARVPGFVPAVISVRRGGTEPFPREIEMKLDRGRVGGGVVQSKLGSTVSDATILVVRDHLSKPGEFLAVAWDRTTSDAEGRWTTDTLPQDLTGFRFLLSHPEYESATYTIDRDGDSNAWTVSAKDSLARKSVMRMKPRLRVSGRVLGSARRALTDVTGFFLPAAGGRSRLYLDDDGRFSFIAPEPGPASLLVQAPGFAPQLVRFNAIPGLAPLEITMQPGFPLRMSVRDMSGQPVTGATVALDSWNSLDLVSWHGRTDSAGRLTWSNAPAGGLEFYLNEAGFHPTIATAGSPADHELTISLRRQFGLAGTVVDAESKSPIDPFEAVVGHRSASTNSWRWDRREHTRFRRGRLHVTLPDGPGEQTAVLIEARGYRPQIIGPLVPGGWQTNRIELHRGNGLRGTVVLTDGTPAARATVVMAEPDASVFMNSATSLRLRGGGGEQANLKRDADYELNARIGNPTIFAAHSSGFAKVSADQVANEGKIVIQPWGILRGHLGFSRMIPQWVRVVLCSPDPQWETGTDAGPIFHLFLRTRPNAKGNFAFDRVPSGEWELALAFRAADSPEDSLLSHGIRVTVHPGENEPISLGERGRSVLGRVDTEGGDETEVNWMRDRHTLTRQVPRSQKPGATPPHPGTSYALIFNTNGEFRIDHVPAGHYTLRVEVTGPSLSQSGEATLGVLTRPVEVLAVTNDVPLDLGTLHLNIKPVPHMGSPAPAIDAMNRDGHRVNLTEHRGKFVLLDFWNSWAKSRTFDLRLLRQIAEDTSLRDQLVILSLNGDDDQQTWEAWLSATECPWERLYLGRQKTEAIARQLGLSSLSTAILVNPEGRLASPPISLDEARYVVRHLPAVAERR